MIVNSTQFLFWLCASGLMLILSVIIISPLLYRLKAKPQSHNHLVQLNISIFKERLAELEEDYRHKIIETDDYLGQKTDLERQLLVAHASDVYSNNQPELSQTSRSASQKILLIIVLSVPMLSFSAYYFLNKYQQPQHRALLDFWANQDQYAGVADTMITGQLSQPPVSISNHFFELLQAMQVNAYQHPFDARRWVNLSQAYMDANAIEPALEALAHAYRLKSENNHIAMAYAQMRFFSLQGKMDSVTQGIVTRILAQNPEHEGALLLMSMATYHDQHYQDAIYWLQRLKRVRLAHATLSQPVNPAIIAQLDQTIRDAEVANQKIEQAASDNVVMIDLKVADTMKSKLHPSDTLFVYARALQGSTVPYAVQKISVKVVLNAIAHHVSLKIMLSDANSMLPERTISSARLTGVPLAVAARISHYSDPMGVQGDLESLPVPIALDATHGQRYVVNIDQFRP